MVSREVFAALRASSAHRALGGAPSLGAGRELGQSATNFDHVFATGADRSFGHALAGSGLGAELGAEASRAGVRREQGDPPQAGRRQGRVAVHISRHGSVDIAPRNDGDRMTLDELERERDEDSSY